MSRVDLKSMAEIGRLVIEPTQTLLAALRGLGDDVLAEAKALAVFGTSSKTRGSGGKFIGHPYRRSLRRSAGIDDAGKPVCVVVAGDFKALWIEFGSINNTAHHVLSRAAERAGLSVHDPRGGR